MEDQDFGETRLVHSAASFNSGQSLSMDNPAPPQARTFRTMWETATKGTVLSSIFILLTTCMGAGTLSLPYAMSQGGIIFFSVVFFFIMLMSVYVGSMLLASKRYCTTVYPKMEVWSYEDLAYASFGVVGRIASQLTIAVLLFLALVAYMIYTRDQLAAVMQFIAGREDINVCTPLLSCGVLMCIAFLPIFPITLLRKLTPLQFTSYLSIFSIVLVSILIMARTIMAHTSHRYDHYLPEDRHINLGPQQFRSVLTVISYCSLSFICHFNLLPLQKELSGIQSKAKLYAIILGALLTAYFIYNIVIFSAYFNFYGCIKPDVMLNYETDDVLMTVARVFLFLTILLHYPVLLHPTRANINGAVYLIYTLLKKQWHRLSMSTSRHLQSEEEALLGMSADSQGGINEFKVPLIPWFLETLGIFCATFMLATFIGDVSLVWNFVGSTSGVLVLYIYPSAFYLRLRYVRYKLRAQNTRTSIRTQYDVYAVIKEGVAWLILVIGLVLLVVENYQAVEAIVDKGNGNSTCPVITPEPGVCYTLTCNSTGNGTNETAAGFSLFSLRTVYN